MRWRRRSPLSEGLPDPAFLYHVHSFVAHPADPEVVLGTAEYGEIFPAVVEQDNIYGAQSHPEKSSTHGLRLLGNFVGICAAAAQAPRGRRSVVGLVTRKQSGSERHQAPAVTTRARLAARSRPRPPARSSMILYPAIDILGGNAVRLVKGDFDARRSTTRTRCRPRAAGSRKAPSTCTWWTSTAPAWDSR